MYNWLAFLYSWFILDFFCKNGSSKKTNYNTIYT